MKKTYILLTVFLTTVASFGQAALTFTGNATPDTNWSTTGNWSSSPTAPVLTNATTVTHTPAASTVDSPVTIKQIINLRTSTNNGIISGSGTGVLNIDTNASATGATNSTHAVAINLSFGTVTTFAINCKAKFINSNAVVGALLSLRNIGNTTTGTIGNVIELGPQSDVEITKELIVYNDFIANFKGTLKSTVGSGFGLKFVGGSGLGANIHNFSDNFNGTGIEGNFFCNSNNMFLNFNTADNVNVYSGNFVIGGGTTTATITVNGANSLQSAILGFNGTTLHLNVNKNLTGLKTIFMGTGTVINLNLGGSVSAIDFANTSGQAWNNGVLNISGYNFAGTNPSNIKFGTDNMALTAGQLSQIVLVGGANAGKAVVLDTNGYLVVATTWNGTAWSAGTPTTAIDAIIAGTYSTTTNGAITAKKLTVNSGTLTINSGTNVTVTNEVINNAGANGIVIENNANLLQTNNVANTGNTIVKRNSNLLSRLDYTMWSSPVTNANQFLTTFSPATDTGRFYNYNIGSNSYSFIATPATTPFAKGAGYLIRMPNTAVTAPSTETFAGQFTGVLNNGNVPVTLAYVDAAHPYNAVGNPYPSAINADTFLTDNTTNIESTLYFWRKTNLAGGSAYATYTPLGGAGTGASGSSAVVPNGFIPVGQGFIVAAKAAGTINTFFTNTMRAANTSNVFFKTKQVTEKSRIWLNLTNDSSALNQILVGYMDGASTGVDATDGKYINDSATALTSNIDGGEYVIQGRPAFDATDVVALNFKAENAGSFTIAKDHADGLFASGQDVYLVDATTGTETNLQTDAYTFTAAAGVDNTRFSLKYQKTLGVNTAAFNDNSVQVYRSNGVLNVASGTNAISSIKVFDVLGRVVAEQNNVNSNSATIKNLKASNQVLLVKVTGADNTVVTKKVVN